MKNRAEIIHDNFLRRVAAHDLPAPVSDLKPGHVGLANHQVIDLFESQVMSRHLDIISRRLRARGETYYTIGSAGHEGNAAFGHVFRPTDMAFLHYRSAALLIQRCKPLPGATPLYDMLLSFMASSDDPVSAGRHKVLGSKTALVPPQTSTIASHLPKAMGTAHAIGLGEYLHRKHLSNPDVVIPGDGLVICNFGDASANHSTAQGAINTAGWASYQGAPMPVVFICEDNGIGISTATPSGWISASFQNRAGIKYIHCDGLNLLDACRGAQQAEQFARKYRRPVFLHTRTIRLMGHAGSDVESGYRTLKDIEAIEAQDPLLHSAAILIDNRILSPQQIGDLYQSVEQRIARVAEQAIARPRLNSREQVMASLIPPASGRQIPTVASKQQRLHLFSKQQRHLSQPQHMARLINLTLADLMLQYPQLVMCGEDIGKKGGVYGVTHGLQSQFGRARVIDTLLDEQSILGLAMGMAHNGFIPMPEIQFLAYVHNAEDQIRGEAATLPFFSNGEFANPMVIRIAGLAYQKGFGGHFHNDNSLAVFRDIPGVVIAVPSNGADASKMLRTCVRLAYAQQRVVIFVEPIALYTTRDLHTGGDNLWTSLYQPPASEKGQPEGIELGEIGVYGAGTDLCLITYGNGYYLSRKAAKQLQEQHNICCTVVDIRWLAPLNEAAILKAATDARAVLIVDECRRTGSQSEALATLFYEQDSCVASGSKPLARVTAADSFIPLAEAANLVLPSVEDIVAAALRLQEDA